MTALVAGLGAVTGYGWGVDALDAGIAAGKPAVAPAHVDGLDVVGAVIPDRGAEPGDPDQRYEQAVLAAVDEAVAEASANGWQPGPVVGVLVGTGIADIRTVRDNYFSDRTPLPSLFPRLLHTSIGSVVASSTGGPGRTSWPTRPAPPATSR